MTRCLLLKMLTAIAMGGSLLLVACGKKPENENGGSERVTPSIQVDTYLEKQDVSCESNQACPNYIAKIVVVQRDLRKVCTGFLVEDNIVATSSSCLPSNLRGNFDCSKDVHFFFPKTANRPSERVACKQVLLASPLDGQDPLLWRDDVAYLELEKPLDYRRQAQIIRDGVQNNRQFTTWMIDQQDEYSGLVKKSVCEGAHNTYVNPLVVNEASPNMMFADCVVTNGGTGAPIIDSRGKVRAIVSQNIDPKLRAGIEATGLLIQPLKQMLHATNLACAPTMSDNDVLDEKECGKDLTYAKIDKIRGDMLSTTALFSDLRKKLEDALQGVSKYVRFGVKLIPKGDVQEAQIYPKCFKPLSGWLATLNGTRNIYVHNVDLPVKSFRRAMDQYARVQGITDEQPERDTFVQFSLKNLRAYGGSSILMWTKSESNELRTYDNITDECSSSLL